MVTVKANTINVEFGFEVNYQWAIDIQHEATGKYTSLKRSLVSRYGKISAIATTAKTKAIKTACNVAGNTSTATRRTYTFLHDLPGNTRDKSAAALLGISVNQLPALREMILNPVSNNRNATSANKKSVSNNSCLEIPESGASVDIAEFRKALSRVKRAITKSALPILNNVYIRAEDNKLIMTCTDLEVSVETTVKAAIKDLKPFTVCAKDLIEAITSAKGNMILDTDEADNLILSIGTKRLTLSTIPADEYPLLPAFGEATWQSMPNILATIADVLPAVSKDETRPVITGILFTSDKLVSTDTHRLHIIDLPKTIENWQDAVVPGRVCAMLSKALDAKPTDTIEIARTDSQVWFRFAGT